jgi:16S rRNA (guanine527-N7)-methyltransferase
MERWRALILRGLHALGLELEPQKVDSLCRILEELTRWNRVHNLTALSDPEDLVEVEILDSLAPLMFPEVGISLPPQKRQKNDASIPHASPTQPRLVFADVGCGAGFPLLPLVVANDLLTGVGIDSSQKRLAFLSHAARVAGVSQRVRAVHRRAELVDERFPLVMARALASPDKAAEVIASLVEDGGRSLLFLSQNDSLLLQGKKGRQVFEYELPFSGRRRGLWISAFGNGC